VDSVNGAPSVKSSSRTQPALKTSIAGERWATKSTQSSPGLASDGPESPASEVSNGCDSREGGRGLSGESPAVRSWPAATLDAGRRE